MLRLKQKIGHIFRFLEVDFIVSFCHHLVLSEVLLALFLRRVSMSVEF
jgi:hypothetical protein